MAGWTMPIVILSVPILGVMSNKAGWFDG